MKIYVKSADTSCEGDCKVYNIEAFYDVNFDMGVYASEDSSIKPVKLANGDIDQQALADYDCFADNVYSILCDYFEVVDVDFSDKSDTSRYFYMYAKNENGDIATKFIIRLRLSDHEYSDRHNPNLEKQYVDKKVQEYKRPQDKRIQKWKLRNIIVNGATFSSYLDAEDAIETEMEEYSKKMYNKGN